jgi:hypothetical protein
MNRILAIALGSSVVCTMSLQAYTYTFKNINNYDVEVHFQLIGINEPIEKITVPARGNDNKPGVVSRSFGGWRIGLCLDTKNALRARALPDGKFHLPIVLNSQSSDYTYFREHKTLPPRTRTLTRHGGSGKNADYNPMRPIAEGVSFVAEKLEEAIKSAVESNPLMVCFDHTFTITETKDHVLVFVYE